MGRFTLKERDPSCLLNPGKLDYPFEKYLQFNHAIDEAARNSLAKDVWQERICRSAFSLNTPTKTRRPSGLFFLYAAHVVEEETFNSLQLNGGKLWTLAPN